VQSQPRPASRLEVTAAAWRDGDLVLSGQLTGFRRRVVLQNIKSGREHVFRLDVKSDDLR
jgi:hypothetical protein